MFIHFLIDLIQIIRILRHGQLPILECNNYDLKYKGVNLALI